MPSYRGNADGRTRATAVAAVGAVHALLAFLFFAGLHVRRIGATDEPLTTIKIRQPVAFFPIARPPRAPKQELTRTPVGRSAAAFERPIKVPITSSPLALSSLSTVDRLNDGPPDSNGAAEVSNGSGTAATGTGSGSVASGNSDYTRFTPARVVATIPNGEYRTLAATGVASGQVAVLALVDPTGMVTNCRVARSSGNPSVDALICALTLRFVRFSPARDPYGRPIAQDITYVPSWRHR